MSRPSCLVTDTFIFIIFLQKKNNCLLWLEESGVPVLSILQDAMTYLASLVDEETGREFMELWQVGLILQNLATLWFLALVVKQEIFESI